MRAYYRVVSIVGLAAFVPYVFGLRIFGVVIGYALGTFIFRVWGADEVIANQ